MIVGRVIVFFIFLIPFVSAFNVDDIPQQYKDLIPKEVLEFIASLTEADKSALKEVYENFSSYKSEKEITTALNNKSPGLAEKLQKLQNSISAKLEDLGPEAKAFAKQVFADARDVRKEYFSGRRPNAEELMERTLNTINKYRALSNTAKADFEKQFPIFAKVFSNEKLAEFIENRKKKG